MSEFTWCQFNRVYYYYVYCKLWEVSLLVVDKTRYYNNTQLVPNSLKLVWKPRPDTKCL